MYSDFISKIDNLIKWSFYFIFFTVPLVMFPDTYELFEFNKMWVVFIMTAFIFLLWGTKMVLQGRFEMRRTPLDIPIALFLVSQIISTFISIEPHTSVWGYYSRFNGGLLSITAYIFLYYAFATNLIPKGEDNAENNKPVSYKLLFVSLLSGLAVTLWGLPSHFGYDPTCLMFRGALDVSCWTEQFQPTVRIFSTLGQPNWMGTFVAALIPVSLGFGLYKLKGTSKKYLEPALYLGVAFLFYLALLYTRSQSSFLGAGVGILIFLAFFLISNLKQIKESLKTYKPLRFIVGALVVFALTTFVVGSPIAQLNKYISLEGLQSLSTKEQAKEAQDEGLANSTNIQLGGSQSSDIRLIVWKGALEIFKRNPLFGTGVETFAYAYYNVKPQEHNLTSEWDYLYNKAHNEYLNYLATTGAFGLASYLLILLGFLYIATREAIKKRRSENYPLLAGIIGGYAAISVSNFFGFSVVAINLLFFLFPILYFELSKSKTLEHSISLPKSEKDSDEKLGMGRMSLVAGVLILFLYFEIFLINFWFADRSYALGYNLNKAGEYTQAFTYLNNATKSLPSEDLYKDELSVNMATLALLFSQNNQATQAAQLAQQAEVLSDSIIATHPKNVVFYKSAIRVQYALAQLDPTHLDKAIEIVDRARELAPTDAKLVYNQALFYNQKGDNDRMVELLDEAIKLKPNYIDPYYAKALLYQQLADSEPQKSAEYIEMAKENLEYILKNIDPNSQGTRELLESLNQ